MVYQPPAGARDLLPLDVAQKRWIEDRLQQVFHQWGYHWIITSTLERLDTLMAGGAIQRSTVIQLQDIENEGLGLRPELTASIARAAVTRMGGATLPLRLYYNANVFRRAEEGSQSRQQEFYQAGVELLGSGGLMADAEILFLMADCLASLHLKDCHLILGEAGLTRSLLLAFPEGLRDQVQQAIAQLDRITLETLPLEPELRDRALMMLDLRGAPGDVLQQVSSLPLDETQRNALNHLKSLVELLQGSGEGTAIAPPFNLILDLSLIRTFDYYTGIVFEVVSGESNNHQVLGQGGRYDQLLSLFHPQGERCPGIGFSLQIESLYQVLLPTRQFPQQAPASDWLVVAESPQAEAAAFTWAQKLRQGAEGLRVELDLGERSPDAIRAYARDRRISQIAWVKATGETVTEAVSQ